MKLERLDVAGFGRLNDLSVAFGDGLTVVSGPNEAGKSTMVECIVRMLFGYPEAQYNKLRTPFEPAAGGRFGATLAYRLDDGRSFEVTRDFARADVPTEVVDARTHRRVTSGNKSTAPGEDVLKLPLNVYRAAAVLRAGELAVDGGASQELAERLAEIIGSAGEASAVEAMEHLKEARDRIGLKAANSPLAKATREADEAEADVLRSRSDRDAFEETIREQATLSERAHDIASRRSRCAAALAAVRLRNIRSRITDATDARRRLDAALEERRALDAGHSPAAFARRDEIENEVESFRAAQQVESDAHARSAARAGDRDTMQRDVDAAGNELIERRAAVARLDETIAAHEAAAKDRPVISLETLGAIEREADDADTAESRTRNLETAAAIARQRPRPSPAAAIGAFVLGGVLAAIWFATHAIGFAVGGLAAIVAGIVLSLAVSAASRARAGAITDAESAAATANDRSERAAQALAARCRSLGCPSVAAVRAARTAQLEIEKVRVAREGAIDAAQILAQRRDALAQRLSDFDALERERRDAAGQAEERRIALSALLDELSIPPGSVDERIAAYRESRDADATAAHADAAVGNARAMLERALAGSSIESLEDEASRYAGEAAAGGDPGEFADRTESELASELDALETEQRVVEKQFDAARGRVAEFERSHPVPVAELEERAAAAVANRDRLLAIRKALIVASEEIERVKDDVHRDFTPPLNEAVGKLIGAITDGRYGRVWIDQSDFTIRVRVPEMASTPDGVALSTGTVQQLQFALRAALVKHLGSGEAVPLLVDDALANADDVRAERALIEAATLARDGQQIVFFTHREALEARAASLVGVNVVRLEGPGSAAQAGDATADRDDVKAPGPRSGVATLGESQPATVTGLLPGFSL